MTSRRRRLVFVAPLALALVACGPGAGSGQPGSAATGEASTPPANSGADHPPDAHPAPNASSTVSQTDTAWGRIWDTVPAGFPRYPGAAPADDASPDPASLRYAISDSDPETIAAWLQAGLETATFSTDVSGPLEDGSFTLDSVGDAGCRIQTTVAPLGGLTFVSVLYGVDCPIQ
jgi:hypothetical protein